MNLIENKINQAVDKIQYEDCWKCSEIPPMKDFLDLLCKRIAPQLPSIFSDLSIHLSLTNPNRVRIDGRFNSSEKKFNLYGEIVWVTKPRFFRGNVNIIEAPPPVVPKTVTEFINSLRELNTESDYYFRDQLNFETQGVNVNDVEFNKAIPEIFKLFEKYPEEDYGAPGRIIHILIEKGGFEEELLKSLYRQPSLPALVLVNYLLNKDQEQFHSTQRKKWLNELEFVIKHPNASEIMKNEAKEFLESQTKTL